MFLLEQQREPARRGRPWWVLRVSWCAILVVEIPFWSRVSAVGTLVRRLREEAEAQVSQCWLVRKSATLIVDPYNTVSRAHSTLEHTDVTVM